MSRKIAWLAYKKMRPALGIPFAFAIMSGVLLNAPVSLMLLVAAGFALIDLFGNFFNDSCDLSEDIRNKRADKFTSQGLMGTRSCLLASAVFAAAGVLVLSLAGAFFMLLGISFAFLLFLYSDRRVRLKGSIAGYMAVSFPYFLLPLFLANAAGAQLSPAIVLSLFFYIQCVYILCQKDSTDLKDDRNMFAGKRRAKSVAATAAFGASASLALLLLSMTSPILFFAWLLNASSKAVNLLKIWDGTITRRLRSRLVSVEFVTPYLFSGWWLL